MKVLSHFRKQSLEKLIQSLVELNMLYTQKSYELNKRLVLYLEEVQTFYKRIGDSENEAKISQLTIYFDTAMSGFDPNKLEKIKIGRRANISISAFYCLSECNRNLESSLFKVNEILNKSMETLSHLMVSALQAKLISEKEIQNSDSLDEIKTIWDQLILNEQIHLVDVQLRMELLPQDILLLLEDIFNRLKN